MPCVPTNVTVHRTCGESPVAVTWDASRGAKIYTAIAIGNSGHRTECTSNDTTCSLEDLLCGQTYSLSVLAVDDACSSTESSMVTLQTGKDGVINSGVDVICFWVKQSINQATCLIG